MGGLRVSWLRRWIPLTKRDAVWHSLRKRPRRDAQCGAGDGDPVIQAGHPVGPRRCGKDPSGDRDAAGDGGGVSERRLFCPSRRHGGQRGGGVSETALQPRTNPERRPGVEGLGGLDRLVAFVACLRTPARAKKTIERGKINVTFIETPRGQVSLIALRAPMVEPELQGPPRSRLNPWNRQIRQMFQGLQAAKIRTLGRGWCLFASFCSSRTGGNCFEQIIVRAGGNRYTLDCFGDIAGRHRACFDRLVTPDEAGRW